MKKLEGAFFEIDALAEQVGGYLVAPSEEDMEYTDLLFDVCAQLGISYYSATPKERHFVEEATRVSWAKKQEKKTGIKLDIRSAFSA